MKQTLKNVVFNHTRNAYHSRKELTLSWKKVSITGRSQKAEVHMFWNILEAYFKVPFYNRYNQISKIQWEKMILIL